MRGTPEYLAMRTSGGKITPEPAFLVATSSDH